LLDKKRIGGYNNINSSPPPSPSAPSSVEPHHTWSVDFRLFSSLGFSLIGDVYLHTVDFSINYSRDIIH